MPLKVFRPRDTLELSHSLRTVLGSLMWLWSLFQRPWQRMKRTIGLGSPSMHSIQYWYVTINTKLSMLTMGDVVFHMISGCWNHLLRNFEVSLSFSIFDSQRSSHRWSSSQFYSNMSSLFSEGEYILANYDYASLENIFPTFKRSHLNPLTPAQNHFNNALAKLRVASEHWNGMLKGMPGFLKELIPVILDEKSARNLCAWLAVCVVLHSS